MRSCLPHHRCRAQAAGRGREVELETASPELVLPLFLLRLRYRVQDRGEDRPGAVADRCRAAVLLLCLHRQPLRAGAEERATPRVVRVIDWERSAGEGVRSCRRLRR